MRLGSEKIFFPVIKTLGYEFKTPLFLFVAILRLKRALSLVKQKINQFGPQSH